MTWFSPLARSLLDHEQADRSDAFSGDVGEQRRALRRNGRLHCAHFLVLALSLLITFTAWWVSKSQIDDKASARFAQEADRSLVQLTTHITHHEDALWGGVAAIEANGGDMTHAEWFAFADALHVEIKYPGVNGIGVIHEVEADELDAYLAEQQVDRPDFHVHPEHGREIFLPISYIEPEGPNAAAVGLDMAHETNRFLGITTAAARGTAQITGPIVLVQDEASTPGFLLFAPWYDDNDDFVGAVYAPFVVRNLVAGALPGADRLVTMRIFDRGELLFDDGDEGVVDVAVDPSFAETRDIEMYGRTWRVELAATDAFDELVSSNEPTIILLGGICIDLLLFAMFVALSRSNRRALDYADAATAELVTQTERLTESNADLEKFAYVASHDLKTPLRGIANLVEWIRDDLEPDGAPALADDVAHNFDRLDGQVERMNALIDGLLSYSRASRAAHVDVGPVHLAEHLESIRLSRDLAPDQLTYAGDPSPQVPGPANLLQVIDNLVNNAVKHNGHAARPRVDVAAVVDDDRVIVTVGDNGPGIEPEYRDRIFEIFETLDGNGTGIGLSIVRRLVTRAGGEVRVDSQVGEGSTFTVWWPLTPERAPAHESNPHSDRSADDAPDRPTDSTSGPRRAGNPQEALA